tara:strand:- start:4888 stop:8169 length:3282 start_codon:yes stop_codon:yes gene_type:complete
MAYLPRPMMAGPPMMTRSPMMAPPRSLRSKSSNTGMILLLVLIIIIIIVVSIVIYIQYSGEEDVKKCDLYTTLLECTADEKCSWDSDFMSCYEGSPSLTPSFTQQSIEVNNPSTDQNIINNDNSNSQTLHGGRLCNIGEHVNENHECIQCAKWANISDNLKTSVKDLYTPHDPNGPATKCSDIPIPCEEGQKGNPDLALIGGICYSCGSGETNDGPFVSTDPIYSSCLKCTHDSYVTSEGNCQQCPEVSPGRRKINIHANGMPFDKSEYPDGQIEEETCKTMCENDEKIVCNQEADSSWSCLCEKCPDGFGADIDANLFPAEYYQTLGETRSGRWEPTTCVTQCNGELYTGTYNEIYDRTISCMDLTTPNCDKDILDSDRAELVNLNVLCEGGSKEEDILNLITIIDDIIPTLPCPITSRRINSSCEECGMDENGRQIYGIYPDRVQDNLGPIPPPIPTEPRETAGTTKCKKQPCLSNEKLVPKVEGDYTDWECVSCESEGSTFIGIPFNESKHTISPSDARGESDKTICRDENSVMCGSVDQKSIICGPGYHFVNGDLLQNNCKLNTSCSITNVGGVRSDDHETCCRKNETCGESGILQEGVFARITSDAFFLESDASDNPEDYIGKIIKIKYNAGWPGGNDGDEIIGKILDYQVVGNQKSITSIEGVCIGTGGTCLSSAETRDECIESSKRCTFTAGQEARPGACLRTGRHQLHEQYESMFGGVVHCSSYSNRNQCEITSKQGEWSNISTTESPCLWRWAQNERQSSCSCNLPTFDGNENRELRPSYIIYDNICPEGYIFNEAINTLCSGETCDIGTEDNPGMDLDTCCVSTQGTCGNSNAEGEAVTDIQCGPDMIYDDSKSSTSCVGTTCDPENIDADKASCCIQPTEHGVFVTGSSCAGANGWYTARGLGEGEASIKPDRTKYQNGEGYRLTNSYHGGWRWQITHPNWTAGQALNEFVIAYDQNGNPQRTEPEYKYPFPPPGLWRESPMASSCNDGGTNSVGSRDYVDSGISLTYHNLPANQLPSGSCKCTTPSSQYSNTCMTRESGNLRNRQDRCPGKTWEQCVGTGAYNISEYRWLGSNAYNLCEWD